MRYLTRLKVIMMLSYDLELAFGCLHGFAPFVHVFHNLGPTFTYSYIYEH